jgi:TetR/AcrR family transcriptional regulator, transcriptional repressor for nem operon
MVCIILNVKPARKTAMGHSRAEKAENHDRILALAAERIREGGLAAINVVELMRTAGLTHGGFYRHFASREDLLAQALPRAFADGEARAAAGKPDAGSAPLRGFVRGYLSKAHRGDPAHGCAIAALAGDIARAEPGPKALLADRLDASADAVAAGLGGEDPAAAYRTGLAVMSTLVGALILARAVDDRDLSDLLLQSGREAALALGSR